MFPEASTTENFKKFLPTFSFHTYFKTYKPVQKAFVPVTLFYISVEQQ